MTHSAFHRPEATVDEFDAAWISDSFAALADIGDAPVHDTEPSLMDIFRDEIVHRLMVRDQVHHEDLIHLIRETRTRLGL
ncbi:hypothetical protein IHV25_03170 [Phaeovibrio sulfidiphilus]|uniref:Uncharacterized protein n=1 Tax=Phaeovibrio sulfidiphilus TaxID=1220600 RepID=A0A8J6YY38_9PROT|nr:hypothetical protein [Phaeovibrio sulfidiphilus]MBE1236653.1 hypothetical protein [Phaeovibrio sulfidiphilus]